MWPQIYDVIYEWQKRKSGYRLLITDTSSKNKKVHFDEYLKIDELFFQKFTNLIIKKNNMNLNETLVK